MTATPNPQHDELLAKILAAATVVKPEDFADDNKAQAIGRRLGEELAAMICARVAPPHTLLAALGLMAHCANFRMVMGICEGVEGALQSFSSATEVLQ